MSLGTVQLVFKIVNKPIVTRATKSNKVRTNKRSPLLTAIVCHNNNNWLVKITNSTSNDILFHNHIYSISEESLDYKGEDCYSSPTTLFARYTWYIKQPISTTLTAKQFYHKYKPNQLVKGYIIHEKQGEFEIETFYIKEVVEKSNRLQKNLTYIDDETDSN